MVSTIILQPPALRGTEAEQLDQVYRYLFKLSEQLNSALDAAEETHARVLKTQSGKETGSVISPSGNGSSQMQELRALVIKTAEIVNRRVDKLVTELGSEVEAISEDYGAFKQDIDRRIEETAEATIEQFDFSERIVGVESSVVDGVTEYRISSLGYIKRGIIGFDEDGFPVYGIAVGEDLTEKTVVQNGVEYKVVDTTKNLATYTADGIYFWVNGVVRAYFSNEKLYVTRIEVTDGIAIGDFVIDLKDGSELTVREKMGAAIDISKNIAMIEADRLIKLMIGGESTDTQLVLTEGLLTAIADKIDLQANESVNIMVSKPAKAIAAGTAVLIDETQFRVTTPLAVFVIVSETSPDGEELLSIDENGISAKTAYFDELRSPTVLPALAGANYTPANGGELEAIIAGLNNSCLKGDVNIDASAVTSASVTLRGLQGGGRLMISGGVINSFTLMDSTALVRFQGTMFSTSGAAVTLDHAQLVLASCALNAGTGLALMRDADAVLGSCTGVCKTLATLNGGSALRITGSSLPYGVLPDSFDGEVYSRYPFEAAPSEDGPTAETISETTLTAVDSRTWDNGWLNTSTYGTAVYQGAVGGGALRRGCMWFDASEISGKTILSATLSVRRVTGVGGGGAVDVGVYGTTATGPSGTPAIGTKYASASVAREETKVIDVTQAVQHIADGDISGLMLYDTQTKTFSGKSYTYGYSKFYGAGTPYAPAITVTYKE